MPRIQLTDNLIDVVMKMSDGNRGAMSVCTQIVQQADGIDPMGVPGLIYLLHLDTLEIYGPRIWMLYKDVCHHSMTDMLGLLRGYQLGFLSPAVLKNGIENYGDGIDIADILKQVSERLGGWGAYNEDR